MQGSSYMLALVLLVVVYALESSFFGILYYETILGHTFFPVSHQSS